MFVHGEMISVNIYIYYHKFQLKTIPNQKNSKNCNILSIDKRINYNYNKI